MPSSRNRDMLGSIQHLWFSLTLQLMQKLAFDPPKKGRKRPRSALWCWDDGRVPGDVLVAGIVPTGLLLNIYLSSFSPKESGGKECRSPHEWRIEREQTMFLSRYSDEKESLTPGSDPL